MMKGFVDLQVNGYLGVDFSEPGLTLDGIRKVVGNLVQRGTVAFCPTVITSPLEVYETNLPVLAAAFQQPDLAPHLLGIHLEGPFISPVDGARGAHPKNAVREPSVQLSDRLQDLAHGRVRIVTLAPDQPGAAELAGHLSARGVVVSLGHHLANRAQIQQACERGAKCVTHLGNGIPNSLPRHPNPLWDQLADPRLTVSLITDGHHLDSAFIRVALAAKSVERAFVVSDASPIAGYPPGEYVTLGQKVMLEESGKLWNPVGNHLVGSSASMLECMNYLASLGVCSEGQLWQLGFENPLALLDVAENQVPAGKVIFNGGRFVVHE